jgi:hypothetical protein
MENAEPGKKLHLFGMLVAGSRNKYSSDGMQIAAEWP